MDKLLVDWFCNEEQQLSGKLWKSNKISWDNNIFESHGLRFYNSDLKCLKFLVYFGKNK